MVLKLATKEELQSVVLSGQVHAKQITIVAQVSVARMKNVKRLAQRTPQLKRVESKGGEMGKGVLQILNVVLGVVILIL